MSLGDWTLTVAFVQVAQGDSPLASANKRFGFVSPNIVAGQLPVITDITVLLSPFSVTLHRTTTAPHHMLTYAIN
jgi:hypothetical protein